MNIFTLKNEKLEQALRRSKFLRMSLTQKKLRQDLGPKKLSENETKDSGRSFNKKPTSSIPSSKQKYDETLKIECKNTTEQENRSKSDLNKKRVREKAGLCKIRAPLVHPTAFFKLQYTQHIVNSSKNKHDSYSTANLRGKRLAPLSTSSLALPDKPYKQCCAIDFDFEATGKRIPVQYLTDVKINRMPLSARWLHQQKSSRTSSGVQRTIETKGSSTNCQFPRKYNPDGWGLRQPGAAHCKSENVSGKQRPDIGLILGGPEITNPPPSPIDNIHIKMPEVK